MGLTLLNNISALTAQNSLTNSSGLLSQTLQRLSTGVKINSGQDGPAALVISQEQQAQVIGLQTAISNASKAVSLVQTAEGALSEINDLLNQIRGLALDSANQAVNDAPALAANQAQVTNALETINRIAQNTQFGTKRLLDGSAGLTGSTNNNYLTFINATNASSPGSYQVNVTTAAQKATIVSGFAQDANTLANNETLTINGISIGLTAGSTQAQVISAINQSTNQTGVVADNLVTQAQSSANYTTGGGAANATSATDLATIDQFGALQAGDQITFNGVDKNGNAVTGTFTYTGAAGGTTLGDLASAINTAFGTGGAASVVGAKLQVDAGVGQGTAALSLSLAAGATYHGTFTANALAATNGFTRLASTQFGSNAKITVQSTQTAAATSSGFSNTQTTAQGVDVAGSIGGATATGSGNVLTGSGITAGISVAIGSLAGNAVKSVDSTVPGTAGGVTLIDNSIVFQIGANANQTAKISVDRVTTVSLGLNVTGTQFANLQQVNVQTETGSQDTIKLVDAAIAQVSTLRGTLGAFQGQTLQATSLNLQSTLTNTTSALSVIRDTDFAAETSNLAKYQVLVQAGTQVLTSSNQQAQLVLALLQGK